MTILFSYGFYMLPGLAMLAAWWWVTPPGETLLRIVILILGFVLLRDAMTPAGLWALEEGVRLAFHPDPLVLALLGFVSLGIVAAMAWLVPDLRALIVWRRGSLLPGLAAGAMAGLAIGLPVRLYYGVEGWPPSWAWLSGLAVLAYAGNALEEVLFRGFLQGYLEKGMSALRAAIGSGVAFASCHVFLALTVTSNGWPILAFTLVEGVACGLVRMRFGTIAAILTHGTAIFLIANAM